MSFAFEPALREALAAEANLAPSVHNIQPTRFRFRDDGVIELHEDARRRLPIGDPTGADNRKSFGAAAEGLVMALAARGLAAEIRRDAGAIATLVASPGAEADAQHPLVDKRATWRASFAPPTAADRDVVAALGDAADVVAMTEPARVAEVARLFDDTSLVTLRDAAYRAELVSWMRLSRAHPAYARDGLNAEAMALSPFEAFAAGIVMGPRAFPLLDSVGLAHPLIAEGAKVKSAAGVVLFHRDANEDNFDVGRRFYRLWLDIAARGLAACPMSVLADSPAAAAQVKATYGIAENRKLVTAFRVGRVPDGARRPPRVRLPAAELIV